MAEWVTKRNDTKPLELQLFDTDGVGAILTGGSAVFTMTGPNGQSAKKVNRGTVTLVTAGTGVIRYDWQSGETDTSGDFKGEVEVTYSDGTIETFPKEGAIFIRIHPDLDEQ